MPRRLVTSEIMRNEKVAELDFAGRWFFLGLITNADDDGRVKGSAKYLKANIFPYDDLTTEAIIEYRKKCHEIGLICFYSQNGTEAICLTGWGEHQAIRSDRYKPSTLPPPPFEAMATNGIPNDNQVSTVGMLKISKDSLIEDNINKGGNSKNYPPQYLDFRKQVFAGLKERRGYTSKQAAAEAGAINLMLKEEHKPESILKAYDILKSQPFWQDKNLSLMKVRIEINEVLKGGNNQKGRLPTNYTTPEEYRARRA